MTRGYVWGQYHSDDGNTYALRVDADYHAMLERGWSTVALPGTFVYPRGWTPRRAIGADSDGHPRQAVVASTAATLWTGAATTFTVTGNDGLAHVCTVFKLLGERFRSRP